MRRTQTNIANVYGGESEAVADGLLQGRDVDRAVNRSADIADREPWNPKMGDET